MSTDAKNPASPDSRRPRSSAEKGIKIFMWPKVIYIFPSAIVSLICAIGMWALPDKEYDPSRGPEVVPAAGSTADTVRVDTSRESVPTADGSTKAPGAPITHRERFNTPQNLLGVLFLVWRAVNPVKFEANPVDENIEAGGDDER